MCILTDKWCCVQWARESDRVHRELRKAAQKRESREAMRASRSCEREGHVPWRPAAGVGASSLDDLPLERFIDDVKRALDIELEAASRLVSIWDERLQHAASMQRDIEARLFMMHARRRRLEERWYAVHVRVMREQAVTTCMRTDAAPQSPETAAIQPSMEAVDFCFEWCLPGAGSGSHSLGLSLNLVAEPAEAK